MSRNVFVRALAVVLALGLISSAACKKGKEEIPEEVETKKLEKDSGEKVVAVIPSPDQAFVALSVLGNPDWDTIVDPIEETKYDDDSQAALVVGMLTSDFFVFVHAEEPKKADNELRKMVTVAKKLDLDVSKKDIKEVRGHLKKKEWGQLRTALAEIRGKMTDDLVEKKKKPELAFLISLGAYLEGTYVISKALNDKYSKKAATILRQHELVNDVQSTASSFKGLKKDKYAKAVLKRLGKLEKYMKVKKGASVSKKNTKKIYELSKEAKEDILKS